MLSNALSSKKKIHIFANNNGILCNVRGAAKVLMYCNVIIFMKSTFCDVGGEGKVAFE